MPARDHWVGQRQVVVRRAADRQHGRVQGDRLDDVPLKRDDELAAGSGHREVLPSYFTVI